MVTQPLHNISREKALDLLKDGRPLTDFYIAGEIEIEGCYTWDNEVTIENCIVEYFSAVATQFSKPVRIINSHFKNCQFTFAHFLGGLTIHNCTFDSYLDFQAGGHNRSVNRVVITDNEFRAFVNFFDCCYEGEVTIVNNKFKEGTNLLGKPNNIPVSFDMQPTLKSNFGKLDYETEGR